MEIYNKNDVVRKELAKYIDKLLLRGLSIEESSAVYRNILYKLESSKDKNIRYCRNYNICIMYLDALKKVHIITRIY